MDFFTKPGAFARPPPSLSLQITRAIPGIFQSDF